MHRFALLIMQDKIYFLENEMVYFSVYPNLTTWHRIFYYMDSGFS